MYAERRRSDGRDDSERLPRHRERTAGYRGKRAGAGIDGVAGDGAFLGVGDVKELAGPKKTSTCKKFCV